MKRGRRVADRPSTAGTHTVTILDVLGRQTTGEVGHELD